MSSRNRQKPIAHRETQNNLEQRRKVICFLVQLSYYGNMVSKSLLAKEKIPLDELTKLIAEKYSPEKIILFGSQVWGDVDEWSDLDLIIVKNTDKRFTERLVDPILLEILPIKTDVFVYTPEEFERMQQNENPFLASALENARLLYEKP